MDEERKTTELESVRKIKEIQDAFSARLAVLRGKQLRTLEQKVQGIAKGRIDEIRELLAGYGEE